MSQYLSIANGYGTVDIRESIPDGFQHIKGKRLQPLCRKLEIQYADALVGFGVTKRFPHPELDGVVVSLESVPKLLQTIAEREARSEKRRLREAKKQAQRLEQKRGEQEQLLEQKREEQRQTFVEKYPNATEDTIAAYAQDNDAFDSLDLVPIDHLTEEEIADFHLVKRYQSGVLLMDSGNIVVPLFRANLPKDESSDTPEQVYRRAMDLGFTAHKALWVANKFVKMVELPPKLEVYDLKDRLLQHWKEYLIDGRIARHETKTCWHCDDYDGYDDDGGDDGNGVVCRYCEGTGIYSRKTLFETRYQFPDDERIYCYHGYTKPEKLSDEPGANKPSYGYRLKQDERKAIPFGLHDLIKIMRHELVLLEEIATRRKREALATKWKALGLPELSPDKPAATIRKCLSLIDQLTAG